MKTLAEPISKVIREALVAFKENPRIEPLFVFPTEIEKNSWINWAIKNPDESGVEAVNTERFIAWDDFKRNYAAAENLKNGKICVPSLLRKIFTQNILSENSKNQFLRQIISCDLEGDAVFAFTDWLSKILPSLKLWKKHYDNDFLKNVEKGIALDDKENQDVIEIFSRYEDFLEKHNFYEPAYFEPNFKTENENVFLFYPETQADYSEYIDTLSKAENVTVISIPEDFKTTATAPATNNITDNENATSSSKSDIDFSQYCIFYPDARTEIRRLVLQIRKLWLSGEDKVDISRIAVSVPDLENIRPYIEREFRLYSIPAVVRNGTPFTRNSGGDIFAKIKDCLDDNFSYESLRNLLTDGFLPWNNPQMNLDLIQLGVKLRCICSVDSTGDKNSDIWEKSLSSDDEYATPYEYYKKIKKALEKFKKENCKNFESLKNAWINFRDEFIDTRKFRSIWEKEMSLAQDKKDKDKINELSEIENEIENYDPTDKILGQMITKLSEYSHLEKDFCQKFSNEGTSFGLNDYLNFFIEEMTSPYAENSTDCGVNIFSYQVAACADFDYHFIINANQNDITLPLKTLSFITDDTKRENFGLDQNDGSEKVVAIYNLQNRPAKEKKVFWSSSAVNFSGAAITHTALKEFDLTESLKDFEKLKKIVPPDPSYEKAKILLKKYEALFENFGFAVKGDKIIDSLDEFDFVKKQIPQKFAKWQKNAFEKWEKTKKIPTDTTTNTNIVPPQSHDISIPESLKNRIDEYVGKKNGRISISASKLNSFYPCSKKWLFQNVMNIDDEKFLPHLAETNEVGTFYHKVIELLFRGFGKTIPIYTEEKYSELEDKIDNAIEIALKDEKILESSVMKSELGSETLKSQMPSIKKTMMNFAVKICSSPKDEENPNGCYGGWTIEGVEVERTFFDQEKNIVCHGYIDCLLSCEGDSEQAVIIDYKSGYVPKYSDCIADSYEKIANFQMAMYVYLLENSSRKGEKVYKVKEGLFYSLQEKDKDFETNYVIGKKASGQSKICEREKFEPTLDVFKLYLEDFAQCVTDYKFETSKKFTDKNYVNPNSDCKNCKFKSICRTSFNVGGKL